MTDEDDEALPGDWSKVANTAAGAMSTKRSLPSRPSSRPCSPIENASGGRARTRRACRDTVGQCRLRSRYTNPRFSAHAQQAQIERDIDFEILNMQPGSGAR
jgi:hypothetical protein